MTVGGNKLDSCSIDNRQALQEKPRTTANEIDDVFDVTMGEKDILFGRGNSMCRRASNRHLLDFVDIFKDHYFASGPFERNQIVGRIVEMLKNDGYSFWKQQKQRYSSTTIPAVIENSDDMDDDEDNEISVPQNRRCWTEMTPSEVQKRVAKFFRKPVPSTDWRKQHDHQHQQQVAAFHQAISTAIDVSSLAFNRQNEELNRIAALDDAISSAIDASSIARAIRDCPSPESSLALSTASSQSAFDPVVSLSDSQTENQLYLESLSVLSSPSPTMEQQSITETAPVCDQKQPADAETSVATGIMDGNETAALSAEANSALPKDGILWSNGSQQISLLGNMESSVIPVKSIALFSNIQQVAFEKKMEASVASSRHDNSNVHLSKTIGYTQQIVGNLTILRPIVLLPE